MKKERIKSFILILLIINSIQLSVQLYLSGDVLDYRGYFLNAAIDTVTSLFDKSKNVVSGEELYSKATKPRRIIINGGGAREVYDMDTSEYEQALLVVNDVVNTMKASSVSVQKISYDQWKTLFKTKSIYVDFGFSADSNSVNVLFGLAGAQGRTEQFGKSSGFILIPDTVTGMCALVFLDEGDNTVYEHRFSCEGYSVLKYIEDSTYGKQQNDAFAFEINLDTMTQDSSSLERRVRLSPLSLLSVSSSNNKEKMVEVTNLFENSLELEKFAEKTLPIFGYTSSSLRKNVLNNGTVIFVENNATIKYHFDGTIEYSAVTSDRGMPVKSVGQHNYASAINAVLDVVKEVWSESAQAADFMNLHFASHMADNRENSYILRFNNVYDGNIVKYDNISSNAVYAEVENGYITHFVMHLVNITPSEQEVEMAPVLAAIDALYDDENITYQLVIDDVCKCYSVNSGKTGAIPVKWAFKTIDDEKYVPVEIDEY